MNDEAFGLASHQEVSGWPGWVERVLVVLGGIAVFVLMLLSVIDALMRTFINAPIFGANDYAQILLSFIVAASLPVCVIAGTLIAIDTLVLMFSERVRGLIDKATSLAGVVMLLYLSWRLFKSGGEAALFGETTLLLQLPFGPGYYALAAGCLISAVLLIWQKVLR